MTAPLPDGPPPPEKRQDVSDHVALSLRREDKQRYQELTETGLTLISCGLRDCAPGAAGPGAPYSFGGYAPAGAPEDAEEELENLGWSSETCELGRFLAKDNFELILIYSLHDFLIFRAATVLCRRLGGPPEAGFRRAIYRAVMLGETPEL